MVTVVHADASHERFGLIDRLTAADGLVLSELVPAFRATGPGIALGALELD